jgi:hypothetical protein
LHLPAAKRDVKATTILEFPTITPPDTADESLGWVYRRRFNGGVRLGIPGGALVAAEFG